MPETLTAPGEERKRKRHQEMRRNVEQPRKAPKSASITSTTPDEILLLEKQILESRDNYNNIVSIQRAIYNVETKPKHATIAAVALCRVFCRLIATEQFVKRKQDTDADSQVLQWLKERLQEYIQSLIRWIGSANATQEGTALTLLMRIVKEETSQGTRRAEQAWRTERSTFQQLIAALIETTDAEGAREEFTEKYVEEYDDVRVYAMLAIKHFFSEDGNRTESNITNALEILTRIEGVPQSSDQLEDWYGQPPEPSTHQMRSIAAHRKTAQDAWLAVFRSSLTPAHRKAILTITSTHILPWFSNRMEVLADFLTDSFSAGGSLSLLALNGIFKLMTECNLDYPEFYTKLYSLLDEDVLHSKHRPRFFRLLDQFMSSSHLPAAMVASFLKRLSRLSLQAPPGAIVWIIPWTYNMLRIHPSCTFLLHRPYHPSHSIYNSKAERDDTIIDPFSMSNPDPMTTGALDSSLWELQTLTDHYHPNVATLTKILGEQFTKRDYALSDFVDHGYGTLIGQELSREMKKGAKVELEWEIPKRVFTVEENENDGGPAFNGIGKALSRIMEATN